MLMNQKRLVIGVVLLALLAYGSGYAVENMKVKQMQSALRDFTAENSQLKKDLADVGQERDAARAELTALKTQTQFTPRLEPYMLDAIKRSGIADPGKLIEDLTQNPSVIPEEPVLGGTMHFGQVGLINERWVYGSYEDGHIAGAAVFQWEVRDSGLIWTPILVLRE